jgi:hypothetical protein
MNRKPRSRQIRKAQRIAARYVPKDREVVGELVERRAEAAAEFFEERRTRVDFAAFDRLMRRKRGQPPRSDDKMRLINSG